MRAVVTWWDLDNSRQTIESLREFLRDEAVDRWAEVRGLCLKFWIADPEHNRWGAVILWESAAAAEQPLPTRAAELIGYPPTHRTAFDVEATAVGIRSRLAMAGLEPDVVG